MTARAWLPNEAWIDICAPITNGSDNRHAAQLLAVVNQFPLVDHPRYQRDAAGTKCNIAVSDITGALGCHVPHWVRNNELRANETFDWFEHRLSNAMGGLAQGPELGWRPVSDNDSAVARANAGFPVVAIWKNTNPKLPGHEAIVMPSADGRLMIAQAGKVNAMFIPLTTGFGAYVPKLYTHD